MRAQLGKADNRKLEGYYIHDDIKEAFTAQLIVDKIAWSDQLVDSVGVLLQRGVRLFILDARQVGIEVLLDDMPEHERAVRVFEHSRQ